MRESAKPKLVRRRIYKAPSSSIRALIVGRTGPLASSQLLQFPAFRTISENSSDERPLDSSGNLPSCNFLGPLHTWDWYPPPTLTGAGPPTNGEYQQGLQPVTLLKVALAGGNRLLVARTSNAPFTLAVKDVRPSTAMTVGWPFTGSAFTIEIWK